MLVLSRMPESQDPDFTSFFVGDEELTDATSLTPVSKRFWLGSDQLVCCPALWSAWDCCALDSKLSRVSKPQSKSGGNWRRGGWAPLWRSRPCARADFYSVP